VCVQQQISRLLTLHYLIAFALCSIRPGIWKGEVRQRVWLAEVLSGAMCKTLGGDFMDEVSRAGDILQIILRKKAKQHFVGTVHIVCGAGSM